MSNRRRAATALAAAALLAPAPAFATDVRDDERGTALRHSMGRVPAGDATLLVTFRDRPDRSTARARLAGLGDVRASLPDVGLWELRPVRAATARGAVMAREKVLRAEWSMARTIDALPARAPGIPALPAPVLPDPTDPLYLNPTHGQWSLRQGTWNPGLTAAQRPIVAILDSGVETAHEEWNAPGLLVSPYSTVRNIPLADDVSVTGHGTHVAGIAAAPLNGVGVVGVAPAVAGSTPVIPVQITNSRGESSEGTMIRGIRWAVGRGAKVVNISSGGPGYTQAFQDTVNWAYRRGALIVASVGNEGLDTNEVNFPAGYDHVIGVAAQCDERVNPPECPVAFARARFSNFNYSVDLLAPGVRIVSTMRASVFDNVVAPGYAYKDGTSMAAPYVAGAAALVYGAHPGISPFQVTRLLESTASRAARGRGRTSTDGWGVVNPAAAAAATAPEDDLAEINDDAKWLPASHAIRLTGTRPVRLTAWADFNDDQFDVYAVNLRRGQRVRVTLSAPSGRLGAIAFRPGSATVSPRLLTERQIAQREIAETRRTTPGTRSMVFRAPQSGRHFISVIAVAGGGNYTLKVQRLAGGGTRITG